MRLIVNCSPLIPPTWRQSRLPLRTKANWPESTLALTSSPFSRSPRWATTSTSRWWPGWPGEMTGWPCSTSRRTRISTPLHQSLGSSTFLLNGPIFFFCSSSDSGVSPLCRISRDPKGPCCFHTRIAPHHPLPLPARIIVILKTGWSQDARHPRLYEYWYSHLDISRWLILRCLPVFSDLSCGCQKWCFTTRRRNWSPWMTARLLPRSEETGRLPGAVSSLWETVTSSGERTIPLLPPESTAPPISVISTCRHILLTPRNVPSLWSWRYIGGKTFQNYWSYQNALCPYGLNTYCFSSCALSPDGLSKTKYFGKEFPSIKSETVSEWFNRSILSS